MKRLMKVFEQEEGSDFWDGLEPRLKESIERGLAQSAKGQVKSHEEVIGKYKNGLES